MARPFEAPPAYRAPFATEARPPLGDDELALRWLGTAGYELRTARSTLLIDPYLTRAPVGQVLFKPLREDRAEIKRVVAEADGIACGHSHFDHLMDAPYLAFATGATLLGSASTCTVGEAFGVEPARLVDVGTDKRPHRVGDFELRFVPSQHGKVFGWRPFLGAMRRGVELPLRVHEYKMGGAYGIWIRVGDLTIYHNGSADLIEREMEGFEADVLLLGLAGRLGTPDYVGRMAGRLKPKIVVPTHYDYFFRPLAEGIRLLPFIKMDDFYASAAARASGARVLMPRFLEEVRLPLKGLRAGDVDGVHLLA